MLITSESGCCTCRSGKAADFHHTYIKSISNQQAVGKTTTATNNMCVCVWGKRKQVACLLILPFPFSIYFFFASHCYVCVCMTMYTVKNNHPFDHILPQPENINESKSSECIMRFILLAKSTDFTAFFLFQSAAFSNEITI